MTAPLWIDRADELAAGVERWRAGAAPGGVALDTEFVFERTFRPRLGLIQIAAGGEIALVDTVRIADLSPLAALLTAPNVRKIVHSGSGDVPILRRATGASPQPLFDTQIAAAFAGLGPSLSYAALIRELFAVELPKHETRTDWLRRPLSTDQLRYAAEDVEQLEAAATELERRLRELGRLEWALEDSAELSLLESDAADASVAWRRVKGLDRLPPHGRAVARALAAWREREADRLDLARSFLLRDETLLALARRDGIAPQEIAKLPGYEARRHAQHAARWVAALTEARAAVAADTAPAEPARLAAEERERRGALEDAISALVGRRAGELGLSPELLLSRRQRDRALTAWRDSGGGSLAESVGGFRGRLLGAELDALAGG
ncbi:MAG: ribonuclease D [Thermoanaerobaculia bacterium]|nr:ribonuclease D [Thermoanaerobaculia bacterium]